MQPDEVELGTSFESLLEEILRIAEEYSVQQNLLRIYLSTHPETVSPRFRTTYLNDDPRNLLRELKRTCSITEDNIDLLEDVIHSLNNSELDNSFKKHRTMIRMKIDPHYSCIIIAPEVTQLISEKIGRKWINFSHEVGVPDATVDEIDNKWTNPIDKMKEVFSWISKKIPTDQQILKVLEALENSGRRDLQEDVNELLHKMKIST